MNHGSKQNPDQHISKIKSMIREFIRLEVVPYELPNKKKLVLSLKMNLKSL
jgi:hypothetical protein